MGRHGDKVTGRSSKRVSEETQYTIRNTHHASLAIIVVSYNVCDLLRACLRATCADLARASEIDATVWVVDNASADGSAAMVAAEFPQVRLVASRENLGFAGGNNLVLRALGFGEPLRGARRGRGMVSSRSTLHSRRFTP